MSDSKELYIRLLQWLKPYRGRMAVAMLCMVILGFCTAAAAWLLKPALDSAMSGGDQRLIYIIPLVIIGLYMVKGAAYYGQSYLMSFVGQRVIHDIRIALYNHLSEQSLGFFAHRKAGELLARMSYDVTLVQGAVSTAVTALMRDTMTIVFLTGVVFLRDWMLACIAVLVFPLVVWPIIRFGRFLRKASGQGQVSMGAMSALVEETVSGIRVVKAFGMEKYEQARFRERVAEFFHFQMKAVRAQSLSFPVMEMLAGFGIAGVVFYGSLRVSQGETTPGTLMSFLAAAIMLYEPVKRLSRANNEIQQGLAGAERIYEILDTTPTIQDKPDALELGAFKDRISFDGVELQYPGTDDKVLKGINLEIKAGQIVAIVGRSGAGKSSMVNMVPRFIDATAGKICIDGHDLRELTQASLRQQMALVTQEVILFNDTVMHNIAYGHDEIDEKIVHDAAKAANAHDFIMQLSDGYQTVVGERGVILSGGQRQRLSLARALLKNAPILILDEATSSLDSESEKLIQGAIDRIMENRTVIVIAHRLSTIRHADVIVVLDKGVIIDMGSHEELLSGNGLYAELYEMQFSSEQHVEA